MKKYLTLCLGVIIGSALTVVPACTYGSRTERDRMAAQATKKALERIEAMEKSNANFRNLTPRARCLELMRDSELPEQECE